MWSIAFYGLMLYDLGILSLWSEILEFQINFIYSNGHKNLAYIMKIMNDLCLIFLVPVMFPSHQAQVQENKKDEKYAYRV